MAVIIDAEYVAIWQAMNTKQRAIFEDNLAELDAIPEDERTREQANLRNSILYALRTTND